MMNKELHFEIRDRLHQAQRSLIVSHVRPDGDAIGSVLALGLSLQALGKQVEMVLADGVPGSFRHLKGSDKISRRAHGEHDLTIVVDCSDLQRTGGVLGDRIPNLNIDHHITNLEFGEINFVLPQAVATAEILCEYMPKWDLPITQGVAEALLTGVVSDTLGFRTSNVTAESLRTAADLVEKGANLAEIYHQALIRRSFEAARFWGYGLEKMQREGPLVWTTLTLEDRVNAGYSGNDDADLVNMLSTIDESDITVIFVQQKDGRVKVSWRAVAGWDVSQVALQFGGGGHPAAAGADISGDLETVRDRVLNATRVILNGSAKKNENGQISSIIQS
jgi:bifunctional oligoribonuclease and PAP phosphatase NrnA